MKKSQMEIPGTDTKLSNAIEDFIELRDALLKKTKDLKDQKDAVSTANEVVAENMLKLGMDTCRHGGFTFRVKEPKESKPKVVVKSE